MHSAWEKLAEIAQQEVRNIVEELPSAVREKALSLTVTFEPKPDAAWSEDGIETDCLGLFLGPDFTEEAHATVPLPAQIVLFLENLWDFAEGKEALYRQELRKTYLHELGHFLGLDEDDLFDRHLE